ncbi:MAG: ABC transporter ATP-binding protein [Pseudomonadota bacterium]
MASIALRSVAKRFAETPAVRGVSLDIEDGEFLSLVGPSGCGKSTLLRLIAGLESPDEGAVLLGGEDVTARSPAARNIAMVFQNYALYPHMSVAANIEVPIAARRLSLAERLPLLRWLSPRGYGIRREMRAEVETLARALEIEALLARKPGQLSGGQRQRVALARAMIREPVAFLMDEPLSNLDAKLRVQLRAEITALHRKLGATFVYVTHDQAEAMSMSDRLAVMMNGRLLQIGTPQTLYTAPADLEVARFIGSPAINEFAGESDGAGRIRVAAGAVAIATGTAHAPGPVTLAVRPELLSVGPENNPEHNPEHNPWQVGGEVTLGEARLETVEWLGAEVLLHLQTTASDTRHVVARVSAARFAALSATGDLMERHHRIGAQPADLHVFDPAGRSLDAVHADIAPHSRAKMTVAPGAT